MGPPFWDIPKIITGWWFQICFFIPIWGNGIQSDYCIFSDGLAKNHPLEKGSHTFDIIKFPRKKSWFNQTFMKQINGDDIHEALSSRWWFQFFFIFTPIWGRFPFWLIFFRLVGSTTNQKKSWFNLRKNKKKHPEQNPRKTEVSEAFSSWVHVSGEWTHTATWSRRCYVESWGETKAVTIHGTGIFTYFTQTIWWMFYGKCR